MQLYKCTLTPKSIFGTPPKGDTIWGHLCWMIRYIYGNDHLESLLNTYRESNPFLVVSDAFYQGYLPKPKMPSHCLGEDPEMKKENRKRTWMQADDLMSGLYDRAKKEDEVVAKREDKDHIATTVKNSINYLTSRTGEKTFAPYADRQYHLNNKPKDLFLLLDESQFSFVQLCEALELFEKHGYGKDSTTGKGRFEISKPEPIDWEHQSSTFMALSPVALAEDETVKKVYYEPFVRFGKFGGLWAKRKPFKKPVLMMDTASTIIYHNEQSRQFAGLPIGGLVDPVEDELEDRSKSMQQGYAILFPIKEPQCNK